MSKFSQIVRARLATGFASGTPDLVQVLEPSQRSLDHVRQAYPEAGWEEDPRFQRVHEVLGVAAQGSPADARAALTQLAVLLTEMTAEDSAVAGDEPVQEFRRILHRCLDH